MRHQRPVYRMNLLIHGLLGTVIAFVMAIPIGPVNLAVIQATLEDGMSLARRIAVGSALAEWFYCLLAVGGLSFVFTDPEARVQAELVLQILSVPLLLVLGVMSIRKPKETEAAPARQLKLQGGYFVGLSLNIANPGLLALWTVVTQELDRHNILVHDFSTLMTYALGAAAGTYLLHMSIALLTVRRANIMSAQRKRLLSRMFGIIFICFALYQLGGLLYKYVL